MGQNFQDHPSVYGLTWRVNKNTAVKTTDLINPLEFIRYLAKRTGMLTIILYNNCFVC